MSEKFLLITSPPLVTKAKTLLAEVSLWEITFVILHVIYQMRETIWVYSGFLKVLYI